PPGAKVVFVNDQPIFNKLPIIEASYKNLQPNKWKEIRIKFTPQSVGNFKFLLRYQLLKENDFSKKRESSYLITDYSIEKILSNRYIHDSIKNRIKDNLETIKYQTLKDDEKFTYLLQSIFSKFSKKFCKALFYENVEIIDESNTTFGIHLPKILFRAISFFRFLNNSNNLLKSYPIFSNQLGYGNYPAFGHAYQVLSSKNAISTFYDSTRIIVKSRHTDSIINSGIGITGKIGWTAQSNHIKIFDIQTGSPLYNLPLQKIIFSYNDQRVIFYDPDYEDAYVLNKENGIITKIFSPRLASITYFSIDHRYCIQLLKSNGGMVAYNLVDGKEIISESLSCTACDAADDLRISLNDTILTICGGLIGNSNPNSDYKECYNLNLEKIYPPYRNKEKYNTFVMTDVFKTHNLYKPTKSYEDLRLNYTIGKKEDNIHSRFQETLAELIPIENLKKKEDLIALSKIDRGIRITKDNNITDPILSIVSSYLDGASFYESFHQVKIDRVINPYNVKDDYMLLSINDSSFKVIFSNEKKVVTPAIESPFYSKNEYIVKFEKNCVFPVEYNGWARKNYFSCSLRNQFHPTGINDAGLCLFIFNDNNSKWYIPDFGGMTYPNDKALRNRYIPIHIEKDSVAYFYYDESYREKRAIYKYDLVQNKILQKVKPVVSYDLIKNLFLSKDKKYILQTCNNGEFYIYIIETSNRINGFYSEGEVIYYTQQGFYDAEIEAANNIFIRFYNPLETFSFHQFESILKEPRIVKEVIDGNLVNKNNPTLLRPPKIDFVTTVNDPQLNNQKIDLKIRYSSSTSSSKIRFFVNGSFIKQNEVQNKNGEITTRLPLAAGCNIITTIIFDSNGFSSTPNTLRLTNKSDLQLPELYILSVGINNYPHLPAQSRLKYATSDAKGLLLAFKKHRKSFKKIHSFLLQNEEATKENILSLLNKLEKARRYDLVILSLAGHGVKKENDFYFLTWNSNFQNPQHSSLNW
ncbi:MAG: hypothetical protein GF329_02365, partial [Candidatus Lokiarchaeota archaeon]|nr:hypothetical protein [Candidatus Lokiarchaeota archaeon]